MTAREFLAAVQQRAVAQRHDRHLLGTPETQAEKDRAALVAALTAALDLAGGWMRSNDGHATPVERRRAKCGQAMEAAITDALTPKENDS